VYGMAKLIVDLNKWTVVERGGSGGDGGGEN
jgi:hypothetical protein